MNNVKDSTSQRRRPPPRLQQKQPQPSEDRFGYSKRFTSFFFTNFPDDWSSKSTFLKESITHETMAELKTVWIGSFKLIVDLTRDRSRIGKVRKPLTGKVTGKSAINVVDISRWQGNLATERRKTFAEVVRMKIPANDEPPQPAPICKELDFGAEQIVMDWPKGALVARVHDVDIIPSLQQRLRQDGF
ncbi:hypothetical protein Ancab_002509 [Ancistrocladus abbreviatus]